MIYCTQSASQTDLPACLTNPNSLSTVIHAADDIVDYTGNLHSISERLVELGDLGSDAEVDGAVADLNDEAANDVGVDLLESVNVTDTKTAK